MSAAIDLAFSALSSAPRRAIIDRLSTGPASISELHRTFDFSKQAMTRHVAVLERAALVERTVRGRTHELRLVPTPLDAARDWLTERTRAWQGNLDRLGALLQADP